MESSDQVNSGTVVETVAEPEPTQVQNKPEIVDEIKQIKETITEPERSQEELAAMLRVLIANFCDQHFVKRLKKAKIMMDKSIESQKTNEQKNENSDKEAEKDRDHIDEIDTANLTLSPPSSSVSNYSQTKPTENESKIETESPTQNQEPSKMSSILVGLDKLEIFGSIHVRSNNVRLLSCLIDEQLTFNNSDVNFSFSSASSSISSAGHYKFHRHRHGHHRRHRGRHGYKKFRKIKKLKKSDQTQNDQEIHYPIKKFKAYYNKESASTKKVDDEDEEKLLDKNQETDNLDNLASVAAQASKLNTEKNSERNRKSRKSSNIVHNIHDDSELEYMNDEFQDGEHFNEENQVALYAEDDENSSVISESFSDSSLLRHRRHRSNSSLYSEPSSIISSRSASNKNNRLSRSPSLGASSYGFENEYRSYSSCSSLSDYDGYGYEGRKSHKRKDKNDRNKSDRKRMNKDAENIINPEDIKVEKGTEKESQQAVDEQEVNPIEERRREEEYLMRKYKRRFSSFKNSETQDQNLYLLETSRQHHRVYDAENNQSNEQQGYMHQKMLNVNSLVDRLSPISDPDMEHNLKNKGQNFNTEAPTNSNSNPQKTEILNRINNLSPSSSSSSSSSIKNQNSLAAFHSLHNSQPNNAAAVLAAAAAAAAAAADLRNIHPHGHMNHNTPLHNHHAQSVAQLLADMQQQQQQQQQQSQHEAAKVLAATLSNHHNPHHPHLNPHHLLGRFSNNQQNDLMAAVLAQQQQQQQHRSLIDTHTHLNSHQSYSSNGQLNQNGPIYNRYSSHLNAAIAAASAAAANLNSHQRRANSVESDATPSPPSTTPAVNGMSNNNSQSISSAASSASSTSENYKYKEEPKVSKDKNDSSNGNEKVRLVPGYDVFISTNDLNACNDDRGSATRLLRNLMDVFFDKSTLAKSSINGTGRITNTLDKHVISALFAYVKNRYADVPHSQLTRAATDKCVQTRRNFRKKIKAAQSYFGMFPSLMMARPPQLPQGSENPV